MLAKHADSLPPRAELALELLGLELVHVVRVVALRAAPVGRGDGEQAVRGEDAPQLVEHGERLLDVFDDLEAHHQAELTILERQRVDVSLLEAHRAADPSSCRLEHRLVAIDSHNLLGAGLREHRTPVGHPAAGVEHPPTGRERCGPGIAPEVLGFDQLAVHLLGDEALGHAVGHACEIGLHEAAG